MGNGHDFKPKCELDPAGCASGQAGRLAVPPSLSAVVDDKIGVYSAYSLQSTNETAQPRVGGGGWIVDREYD